MTDKDKIKKLEDQNEVLQKQVNSLLRDKDHLEEALRNERAMEQMRVRRRSWGDTIQMSRLQFVEV